jgi:propionyl-CoA carboxylase beta chain
MVSVMNLKSYDENLGRAIKLFYDDILTIFSDGSDSSIVSGLGLVDGRQVYFYGYNYRYMGGSLGIDDARVIMELVERALDDGKPLVTFIQSAGARIQGGVSSLEGYALVFKKYIDAWMKIPLISIIIGSSVGGASITVGLSNINCLVPDNGYLYLNGPKLTSRILGIPVDPGELGGVETHSKYSGLIHIWDGDLHNCISTVRGLLNYIPDNCGEYPRRKDGDRGVEDLHILDGYMGKIYGGEVFDVRDIIRKVLDEGSFIELSREYAPNITTGFGRIDGISVGVVANNRLFLDGRIDSRGMIKLSWFIEFCNGFNIPIITFVDTPGFWVGIDEERGGIIRSVSSLVRVQAITNVPRINIIIGKAYGGGYIVMGCKNIINSYICAWPSASISVMSGEDAYEILRHKIGGEVQVSEYIHKYREELESPVNALKGGYVDDIIQPGDTRRMVVDKLNSLLSSYSPRCI